MTFNLDTCKIVVWGYKTCYHTHSHIHDGIFRALRYMNRDVEWLDAGSNKNVNSANTLFITNHDVTKDLPLRDDCFYFSHGLSDYPEARKRFEPFNWLAWNVYRDFLYEPEVQTPGVIWLDEDMPFLPERKLMFFRWATDQTPDQIQKNKIGATLLQKDSRVINYIGTYWHVNKSEISEFERACNENGVTLKHFGGGQVESGHSYLGHGKVVSPEDNVRLVRESYFAPAIVGSHHLTEGYIPCRIFKNISYGQFGVTNSKRVNDLFGRKLIFDPNPYTLFRTAQARLKDTPLSDLYNLMDEVAEKHTYINRLNGVFKAIRMTLEGK